MAIQSDVLVIGSGAAGLSFALRAAKYGTVTIVTKKEEAESNTNYAQGGIAAVFDPNDTFESHIEDTFKGGVGLCYPEAVKTIVTEGPERIKDLTKWGIHFTLDDKGKVFDLGREGGHSKNRIVHAMDKTGRVVEHGLLDQLRRHPNINILDNHVAVDLITEHHVRGGGKYPKGDIHCWGSYVLNCETGKVEMYLARVTLLATGGAGQVYQHTSNPAIATGDGVAMAYRAGAAIGGLEFMQFHPTTLYHSKGKSFLISEAVRGHGGILRNKAGEAFMKQYHELGELAARDIVARAIDSEIKRSGDECVYLDVTHIDADNLRKRFPQINEKLLALNLDMTKEMIPVVPAAHYMCGGVITNLQGQTSVEGLYATGEVACTGVHGANRLASNSLLEALVFSERAFHNAKAYLDSHKCAIPTIPEWDDEGTFNQEEWVLISHDRREIQRLMWDYVGIVRSDERLERAGARINLIRDQIESYYKKTVVTEPLLELRNMSLVASLIIRSALYRKESRGLHYTTDYPQKDDINWLGLTVIHQGNVSLKALANAFGY